MRIIYLLIIVIFLIYGCSEPKIHRDDAVRIKKGLEKKYNSHPKIPVLRNGSTLRGEVIKIQVEVKPDSCPINDNTKYQTNSFLLFTDSSVKSENVVEKIPLEDVELVGLNLNIPKNQYNNINYFETYNNPLLPLEIREVPVDTIYKDCNATNCPCEPLSIDMPCILCLKCPERELSNWFVSAKPGLSFYNDINEQGNLIGRDDYLIDLAFGYRWGISKRWAAGLLISNGIQTLDKIDENLIRRPSINIYARYDLIRNKIRIDNSFNKIDTIDKSFIEYDTLRVKDQECCEDSLVIVPRISPDYMIKNNKITEFSENEVRPCLNPFVYGLIGANFDGATIDLFKISMNEKCKVWNPDAKIPINIGLGIGLDIPITKWLDLSTDIGIRSIDYGDKLINSGKIVPKNQRINSIVFRLGFVY